MPAPVTTQHNDNSYSGANLRETDLNVKIVKVETFGRVSRMQVDGHVYAQPLLGCSRSSPHRRTRTGVSTPRPTPKRSWCMGSLAKVE